MSDSDAPPPDDLPEAIVDELRACSDHQLHAVIDYARGLLAERHSPTSAIEPREGEEILAVEDHGDYTSVVVERPGASGEAQGPFAYRVEYVPDVDGDGGEFKWYYLGPVADVPGER